MTKRAQILIAATTAAAVVATGYAIGHWSWTEPTRFATVLVVAMLASRLKVKLPGLTGNMAFNLPFLLLAVTEFHFGEAILIAAAATAVQCFPFKRPVRTLFNVATVVNATALASLLFNAAAHSSLSNVALPLACAVFFVANTPPVAMVIAFTENQDVVATWQRIFNCSFVSFVLSTGMASLVLTADRLLGWKVSAVCLAMMFLVRHSFRFYFTGARANIAPQSVPVRIQAEAAGD